VAEGAGGVADVGSHDADRAMRCFGGAPTYWLTDNEKTVTVDYSLGVHIAQLPSPTDLMC
jgi:hypothetical protein